MVILKNTRRQPFIFSLYHDYFCRKARECFCVTKMVPGPNGKMTPVHYPKSVQIDALKESEPLHPGVYNVPQVKHAVERGWLIRRFLDPKMVVKQAEQQAKPAKTVDAKSKKKDKE